MNRQQLSQKIIDTCLEMTRLGLNQGTAGNVSVRYQDGMLITPTGTPYEQMTVDSIVFVDKNGRYEQGKLPSSEWHFHLAVYQSRQDVNAVVHNHAINCAAVSILEKSIPPFHYMIAVGGTDHIPCVPYATFGTHQLAEYVADGIKTSKAILLAHHGLIAAEKNLDKALWLAHEVEVLAEWYIKLLATGLDIPLLSKQQMAEVLEKFKSYGLRIEE
ncbi:L-fuculose-phosphate aldolase [Gallibacterium anatis]|jgi:L-fuculose-phosphate aldolase|uniref:L-fuculose phosphate aldolase n=5 Tax=Gallibacterium TaxID=155493 RepID=A0A0A2ZLB9_9PAST|nr:MULTISPECIES: L-fuculose-phosphate aldolase [Gallibacterium]AEC17259.1 L-fuculose phosphate aldolase [Gallibacterium anatis UMN179]ERF78479.1 fuculose phosphate aldolase [Gallibacterium anatis 12656/12]KGQ29311.1 fuculose phosphate aldolase [Gallibacterium anatis]KGQ36336.1 fuculose phosphate aldolase [Gallibacterium anatis]KGQ37844.1 fuculose phosphate aldolase [Gallibacterium genomosp. 1]